MAINCWSLKYLILERKLHMNMRVRNHGLACYYPLFSCLVINECIKKFDLSSSIMMGDYVCVVYFLFVTSLLEPVSLFVLDNSDYLPHFTSVANIYQTFERFSWTQTEILLPKSNPCVAFDPLVVKVFLFNSPGHPLFHGCKDILQALFI